MKYQQQFQNIEQAMHYYSIYRKNISYDSLIHLIEQNIIEKILFEYVGETHNKSLLDFACGFGRILDILESKFRVAYGVDVSPAMIALAQTEKRKAKLFVGDIIRDENLLPGPFDVITSFRFLLNADTRLREEALLALRRRMAEESILIINNHGSAPSLRSVSIKLRKTFEKKDQNWLNEISQQEFRDLAYKCGFSIVTQVGTSVLTPNIFRFLGTRFTNIIEQMALFTTISQWIGSNQIYVLKRKKIIK